MLKRHRPKGARRAGQQREIVHTTVHVVCSRFRRRSLLPPLASIAMAPVATLDPNTPVPLTLDTLNPRVISAEYAVRGEIVARAQAIDRELQLGTGQHPFSKIVWCNIGNPQILGQKPMTYFRQVLSLIEYPKLLELPGIEQMYPSDVIGRAKEFLEAIPGGLGAYSESPGAWILRQKVAAAIEKRDGYPCQPEDIYMTDGASPGVHYMTLMLMRTPADSFMVPIPQYPLYSATLALYGGQLVPYALDEGDGWTLSMDNLRQQLATARQKGLTPRGMVVINPGNPTGQCLSYDNIADVINFCREEGLVLIADEVYQSNIYTDAKEFFSFKKVMRDLEVDDLALVSLHSTSKGFVGECGRRGGYMEIVGFPADVRTQVLKLASINLCPNVSGQICATLMMTPPEPGEPSYELYIEERDGILSSLRRRSCMLVEALNALPGVSCNEAEGALYAFPRITLPPKAVEEARRLGKPADWLYCKELLEACGIVVVPGSGFGQADGTFHFRTTFLPPEEDMGAVCQALCRFHADFLAKYGGLPSTNGNGALGH